MASAVATTCPYCGVGCGVSAKRLGERSVQIAGDADHPANLGRLCSKGAALGATVGLEGRLLRPLIKGRRAGWDRAIRTVADRFSRTIARHGPDAVAFYVSGQLLTEDYYAANKLMKGFIGSGNIDTNSRLCMASAVAAHKQAFGADLVPGCYEDLELADLVVFAGHNAAWTHPVLYRRMEAARAARGQRHVVIDPRRTDTADGAEVHLAIAPQSDVRLWNGLLADLIRRGAVDRGFLAAHVNGFAEVEAALAEADQSPAAVAADCGVERIDLDAFFDLFARTERTVSLFSQGSNQSAQGVAKGLAVLNAHLATGRIGKPGAAPFSITGQPNAMGGREVGGMANTLAAHMEFDPAARARLARFWGAPRLAEQAGLKAVDLFDAMHDGRIKAVWIMATNPAVSLPNATRAREALARCEFVAVSDCVADTDTMAYADVALPALAWGEKDGTVTNSERCISRQRPLFEPPGEAKADWRIVAEVAAAMGHADAFAWREAADVFQEWARLTAYENDPAAPGARFLDLSGLSALTRAQYDTLAPVQWPLRANEGATTRLFTDGCFQFPDGRARLVPVRPKPPAAALEPGFPLSLNTGRLRDQWHTMTRTGLAPALCRHAPEPYVEVHPADAGPLGIADGALSRVRTRLGEAVVRAVVSERQRRGSVFMPMHFTDAFAPSGKANPLVTGEVDPVSGQPEFKHTPARLSPYRETWSGFLLDRSPHAAPVEGLVWRRIPEEACQRHEFAGRGDAAEREAVCASVSGLKGCEVLSLQDACAGALRQAWLKDDRLQRVLFISAGGRLPPRDWLAGLFGEAKLGARDRAGLLLGRLPGAAVDVSPLVCACRGVTAGRIEAALAAGCPATLDAVGERTGAGITCGSCRPEIARRLAARPPAESLARAA